VARQKVPKLFSGPSVFTIQKFNFVKGYYIRQRGKVLEVRYLKITFKKGDCAGGKGIYEPDLICQRVEMWRLLELYISFYHRERQGLIYCVTIFLRKKKHYSIRSKKRLSTRQGCKY
jgi:hypothetical protein